MVYGIAGIISPQVVVIYTSIGCFVKPKTIYTIV